MSHFTHHRSYLLRWDQPCAKSIDHEVVVTSHRLAELAYGEDPKLVELISDHPRDAIRVFTMGTELFYPSEWQAGELSDLSAQELLNEIRHGRLIVVLGEITEHSDELADVVDCLYSELTQRTIISRPSNLSGDLVIGSPSAIQYFTIDQRSTIRWQLRGRQTIYAHLDAAKSVDPIDAESVILDGSSHGLYYEPDFAQDEQAHLIEPGQMISLPHGTPYHSHCDGDLCVWLQTQHDTPISIRNRSIHAANRVLSLFVHDVSHSHLLFGTQATIKHFVARLLRLADHVSKPPVRIEPTFRVIANQHNQHNRVATDASLRSSDPFPNAACLNEITRTTTTHVAPEY